MCECVCVCIKGEVVALGAFTGAKYTHSFTGLKKKDNSNAIFKK